MLEEKFKKEYIEKEKCRESSMRRRAAILDDDKIFGELLKKKAEPLFEKYELDVSIDVYTTAEELMSSENEYALLFMEIVMPETDGVEFVREWQGRGKKSDVIYVSAHEGEVFRTFGSNTIDFVRKRYLNTDLERAISLYRERKREKMVALPEGQKNYLLDTDDILYLKSSGHYIDICMWNGDPLVIRGKLNDFAQILEPYDFVRIHVRYLVNLRYVEFFTHTHVFMKNKESHRISMKYRNDIYEKMLSRSGEYGPKL